jgi:E3 ubiquitin-protein ligase RNF144
MAKGWSTFIERLKPKRSKKHAKTSTSPSKRKKPILSEAECQVCLDTEQCLTTSKCNHAICVKCLGKYISVTHHSRMPCPCPSSAICKSLFTIDDITPFVNDTEIAKIWLCQATIQIEKGLGMYCPNPTCSKPILWKEKLAKKKEAAGKCRNCEQPICIPCKSAYHNNMTYSLEGESDFRCSQYKDLPESERSQVDMQLFALARANAWKRCPGCHIMVQKASGCFYMTCSCGTRFCYQCGVKVVPIWGLRLIVVDCFETCL